MSYDVELTPTAQKQFKKLSAKFQNKVLEVMENLALNPLPHGYKNMHERKFVESQLIDLIRVLQIVDNSKSKDADFLWCYG